MHEFAGSWFLALQSAPQLIQQPMTAMGGMDISELVPILVAWVGALAAWIGVGVGIRRFRLERRMYSLSVEAERRKEPAMEVYLADFRILNPPSEERRIYIFRLLISNTSLSDNSIKRIELTLEYGRQGKPLSNVAIPHDSNAASAAHMEASEVIHVPCSVAGGATIKGAVLFPISTGLIENDVVESHTITVADAHGRDVQGHAIFLREVRP